MWWNFDHLLNICYTSSMYTGTTKQDIPIEQRRGAIIVLGMLANDTPEFLADHVNLMAKIGLSPSNVCYVSSSDVAKNLTRHARFSTARPYACTLHVYCIPENGTQ